MHKKNKMYDNKKPMLCPFCKQELIIGEQKRYENLCDHVSDPNMEDYPLRDTYVCTCEESKGVFWDWFGDTYSHRWISGNTEAINSSSYESRLSSERECKLRRHWWYRIFKQIQYRYIKFQFDIKYGKQNNLLRNR